MNWYFFCINGTDQMVDRTSASDTVDSGSIHESSQAEDFRKLSFRASLFGVHRAPRPPEKNPEFRFFDHQLGTYRYYFENEIFLLRGWRHILCSRDYVEIKICIASRSLHLYYALVHPHLQGLWFCFLRLYFSNVLKPLSFPSKPSF